MDQPDVRQIEEVKKLAGKIATAYVEGLKEIGGDITKSWVCGAVCGGGCSAGCGGGCVGGCAMDGPIPVGDVYAAGGAGGASGGVATGIAEGY